MLLLDMLRSTNSRVEKAKILAHYVDSSTINAAILMTKMFEYALNPFKVYGMKWGYINNNRLGQPSQQLFNILDSVLNKHITGDAAKLRVESFAKINGDLIKLIINKKLDCGVSAKTFNAVYPDSIFVPRAQKAKEVPIADLEYPLLAQIKYDGVRLQAINRQGKVKFFTYNGQEVPLRQLQAVLEAGPFIDYVLDGEIVWDTGRQEDRGKISGMINSAMHGGLPLQASMRFYAFDLLSIASWDDMKCSTSHKLRFTEVNTVLSTIASNQFIPAYTIRLPNVHDTNLFYEEVLAQGYEGLMLKHDNDTYKFKRSKDWVKMKATNTVELRCIQVLPGKGKYEGMIGALLCQGTIGDKIVTVSVGSGLTDLQRGLDPTIHYLNELIEVKYNDIVRDSVTQCWSLFLPRFACVRFDK